MSLTPLTDFTIKVTMTSDWHVGSGSGRGEIDSVVQRDSDGLPYIPAKTLTGILRDGCEQVAQALDSGHQRGKWHQWINFLFGDQPTTLNPEENTEDREQLENEPRPAALGIRSARFNVDFRNALNTKQELKAAIAFMKPGVAIAPKTGSAKPDCLRVEEVVRMDAVLTAENCTLDFSEVPSISEQEQTTAYALLIAGASMVERLGGKRRRGNGTCQIEIDDKRLDWLKWLKNHHGEIGNPPQWEPPGLSESESDSQGSVENSIWYSLPLTITTESPIVLRARTVGNVVESLDYIPGRYLLRYLRKKLGSYFNVGQAIARGELVITNATIAIGDAAGRPTPFCLFSEKLNGGLSKGRGSYNRFQEAEPRDIQLRGERRGYLGEFDQSQLPEYKTVSLELFTHNTIQDEVQRPTSDLGGVYSYQAIPEGTMLKAELRLPQITKKRLDSSQADWWNRLCGCLRIGQSKKDQYGAVSVTVSPTVVQHESNSAQSNPQQNELYVWCLSDVLLRDQRLNPTTSPKDFKDALATELGVTLEERAETNDCLAMMVRSRRTESWQVRWGLPRPSMLGFQAGSCMVYQVQGEIPTPEKLAEIEARGIGDRRAEGYGQICFNDPLLITPLKGKTWQKPTSTQPDTTFTPMASSDASFDYARSIELAAWRGAIQSKALAIAADSSARERILGIRITRNEKNNRPESQPSMSQLGGLRSVMGRLINRKKNNPVTRWLSAIQAVENRKQKWPESSFSSIHNLVTDFALIWTHLGFDQAMMASLTITANGGEEIREKLWAEAVRTLVDTTIRAHKRALEEAEKSAQGNQTENGEAA